MAATPPLVKTLGQVARSVGKGIDAVGLVFQDHMGVVEKLVPSTRVVPFKSRELKASAENFVASNASIVGDVRLGERASAWYGATVRGDGASVTIGRNSAVMDNAVVSTLKGRPTTIGQDVTICPGATVQSASIGDGAMIGMGAVVLPGATVGADSFVDAGAVVSAGSAVPPGQLWTGAPARHLRALSADEMAYLRTTAGVHSAAAQEHAAQCAASVEELEQQQAVRLLKIEGGFAPDTPVSQPDADVVEYYRLTAHPPDHGLFRATEHDMTKELAARETAEQAADAAEEAYFAALARSRRVGEAMRLLAASRADRPEQGRRVVGDLEARDPEGAAMLRALVGRAAQAAAAPAGAGAGSGAGAASAKEEVLRQIATLSPPGPLDTEDERRAAVAGVFDALAAHARAGSIAAAGGPGAMGMGAGAPGARMQ